MTDSQTIFITEINRCDIVNNNCELNLSDKQIAALSANACITVVGSITCNNALFDTGTLRVFKCKLLAEKYIVELLNEESLYCYVQVQIQDMVISLDNIAHRQINRLINTN